MHAAHRLRPPTAHRPSARPTTRTREPMRRHIKPPTPMGATEARSSPRTAIPLTPSTQTTSNGTVATAQTSAGGTAVAASGKYGNSGAVAQTANGNKYAAANGNVYKNTGSGWNQTQGTPQITSSYSGSSSAASHGYGGEAKERRLISLGRRRRQSGWQSRAESARGSASRGGGGGWGGGDAGNATQCHREELRNASFWRM